MSKYERVTAIGIEEMFKARDALRVKLQLYMQKYAILAQPIHAGLAFDADDKAVAQAFDWSPLYLVPMLGLPSICVPLGFTRDVMPHGILFTGCRGEDQTLLKIAHLLEKETGYGKALPPLLDQLGATACARRLPGSKILRETAELVGVAGFEPATPSSRTRCATRLRHTPPKPVGYSAEAAAPASGENAKFDNCGSINLRLCSVPTQRLSFPKIGGCVMGRRQVVRQRLLMPSFAGSIPAAPATQSTLFEFLKSSPVKRDAVSEPLRGDGHPVTNDKRVCDVIVQAKTMRFQIGSVGQGGQQVDRHIVCAIQSPGPQDPAVEQPFGPGFAEPVPPVPRALPGHTTPLRRICPAHPVMNTSKRKQTPGLTEIFARPGKAAKGAKHHSHHDRQQLQTPEILLCLHGSREQPG